MPEKLRNISWWIFWKVSRIKGAFQHPLKAYTNGAIHGPENAFENQAAYDAHVQYVAHLRSEFNIFMLMNGPLRLLSAAERDQLRAEGATINEYTEADHEEEGPENA